MCNPFQYWAENKSKYPTVALVARAYLGIPATSVTSESFFLGVGLFALTNDHHWTRSMLSSWFSFHRTCLTMNSVLHSRRWVTQLDPWPTWPINNWPMTHLTHDPWVTGTTYIQNNDIDKDYRTLKVQALYHGLCVYTWLHSTIFSHYRLTIVYSCTQLISVW